MICHDAKERLPALADGELPPVAEAELAAHLEGCAACAAEAERMRGFVRFLTDRLGHLRDRGMPDLAFLDELAPPPPPRKAAANPDAPAKFRSVRIPAILPVLALVAVLGTVAWFALGRRGNRAELDANGAGPVKQAPGETRPEPPVRPATERPVAGTRPEVPHRTPTEPRVEAVKPGATQLLPRFVRNPSGALLEEIWSALARKPGEIANVLDSLDAAGTPEIRAALVLALAGVPDDGRVRGKLLEILSADSDSLVRRAAAAALARIPAGEGRVGVFGSLSVPVGPIADADLRSRLLQAAEAERDPAALGVLIRLLGPSQESDSKITDRFLELARGDDEAIRNAAIDAIRLGRPNDPRIIYDLLFDVGMPVDVRARLVDPAVFSDPETALERIRDILARSDAIPVKAAAVQALARVPSDEAFEVAVGVLRGGDDTAIRMASLGVVLARPTKESLEVLTEIAAGERDPGLERAAEEGRKRLAEELEQKKER